MVGTMMLTVADIGGADRWRRRRVEVVKVRVWAGEEDARLESSDKGKIPSIRQKIKHTCHIEQLNLHRAQAFLGVAGIDSLELLPYYLIVLALLP